ncbi:hypothetical protein AZ78_1464 [Lysobacter capsici AZ78]|uniref:Uncharacterized protein n=1 Tax=Lysobacter capsici AZ78 TaxID=1444315 RepID=A0A108U7E0_9GAMM|nr:hypothetical protein AZ78_1464 [Lysobacter capsici AZ78]
MGRTLAVCYAAAAAVAPAGPVRGRAAPPCPAAKPMAP